MIPFQPYGLIVSLGIIAAGAVILKQAKKEKIKPDIILDCGIWGFVGGLIGARIYHVLDFWNFYSKNPTEIFKIWQGGLGIFGGLIGGSLAVFVYTKIKKINFAKFADLTALGIPLAQAIGRWANFVNQELYGYPTNLPWAIYISPENRLEGLETSSHFHPLFLYESLWNLLVFLTILKVAKKFKKKLLVGEIFLLYLILYSFGRFFLEFLRPDSWQILRIRVAQIVSFLIILTSISLSLFRRKVLKKNIYRKSAGVAF